MAIEANVLQVVQASLENVLKDEVLLYPNLNVESPVVAAFTRSQVQPVGRDLWRMPFEYLPGGYAAKTDFNGGVLPIGAGPAMDAISGGYFGSALSFQFTDEQKMLFDNSPLSARKIVSRMIASSYTRYAQFQEAEVFTDGSGILTRASTAIPAANQYTFAGATDTLRLHLLDPGTSVDVWNGATKRAFTGTNVLRVLNTNHQTGVVTLTGNVTAQGIGDVLAIPNLNVYGPASPTAFAAAYPGARGTAGGGTAGGIGGDSFRHGYTYMLNANPANFFFGKQRSAYPRLAPLTFAAGAAALTPDLFYQAFAVLHQNWRTTTWKNHMVLLPDCQRAALANAGVAASNFFLSGDSLGNIKAMLPDQLALEDTISIGSGLVGYITTRMPNDEVWIVDKTPLFRAVLEEPTFYKDENGNMFWQVLSSDATGIRRNTAHEYSIKASYDYGAKYMGHSFTFTGLAVPAGLNI